MGRYEVLLEKPKEEIVRDSSNWGKEDFVPESPENFLEKLFRERMLTKAEINESLVGYYGRFSDTQGLRFEIFVDEENGGLEISPANDYTAEIMQKVRNVFKHNRT